MKLFTLALAFCLLILVPEFVRSEILASSSYPMAEANPSRNRQINRKLLCPEVAPGRTQVWNIEWRTVLPDGWFSATELTQDEQGFVYFQAGTYSDPNSKILKINGKDGSYDTKLIYSAPFPRSTSIPTHVKGNKMYIAAIEMTTIVNTTSMTDIAVIPHSSYFLQANPPGSYAPLNNDFMVTAHPDQTAVDILRYLNSSAQFDSAQPNFAGVYANNVIIYTTKDGGDIPIVVMARAGGYDGTISVWSPNYQFTLPGDLMYDTSYVQNNQLYIQYQSYPGYIMTIAIYDPETGEMLRTITKDTWNGQSASFANLITFGNKSIGYVYSGGTFNVIDFSNEITLIEGNYLWSRPTYSIPDNSVFLSPRLGTDAFQFISLDWDTNVINAVGSFPTDAYYGDISVSPPMVGDECMLYSYFDDNFQYSRGLLAFKPLPVSDVVPILECINDNGVGYFSYHNLEDKRIIIPYAKDRNNLEPMKMAPATDFQALQRGKYFPLSSRVTLANTNSSFTWLLEDYVLSFNNTEQLRCPSGQFEAQIPANANCSIDVRFIMYFNATNAVPSSFDEWTRKAFVNITGISESRVTVVAISQGSVSSDFKVALQVTTGSSGQGLIPEQIVQTFAEQQLYRYNQQLATDPTYSSANITVVYIDGAGPLSTEISGTNPSQPVDQAPISQPNPNQPQSPVNTPKATSVSSASLLPLSSGTTTLVLTFFIALINA